MYKSSQKQRVHKVRIVFAHRRDIVNWLYFSDFKMRKKENDVKLRIVHFHWLGRNPSMQL